MKFLALLAVLFSCAHKDQRKDHITLIKQWHLSPTAFTTDIEASKKLPQFENQKQIYAILEEKIKKEGKILLLAEGCERTTEIDKNFKIPYNGWTYQRLESVKEKSNYEDILTLLPLKLKAKYPDQVTAICADDEDSIKMSQLSLSDTRGYLGFYLRLSQTKNDKKKFQGYKEALEDVLHEKAKDPITTSKAKAVEALNRFQFSLDRRNAVFLNEIENHRNENPILIVGGLHAKGLEEQIKKSILKLEVITPKGYPIESEKLIDDFTLLMKQ